MDDNERVTYKGKDEGGGHFILECPKVKGKATLHRTSPSSKILEGYWAEDGEHGFWRIYLK